MQPRRWIALGALLAALGVALGAFGAHALRERLTAAGQLENWETATRYLLVHALALVAFGLFRERVPGNGIPGWCFLLGSLFFSGSIACLCFRVATAVMGPLTPLGGVLLIGGWIAFAVAALRR